jgi:hypothetical protein
MRFLLPLLIAGPLLAADIGSPVPQPTGNTAADVARIVSYLEKSEARSADLAARLDALEARLAALERPAPKVSAPPSYLPPTAYPVYLPPAQPVYTNASPPMVYSQQVYTQPVRVGPVRRLLGLGGGGACGPGG